MITSFSLTHLLHETSFDVIQGSPLYTGNVKGRSPGIHQTLMCIFGLRSCFHDF